MTVKTDDNRDTIHTGTITENGSSEPAACLKVTTVVGKTENGAQDRAVSMIMSSVAFPLFTNLSVFSKADSANGVAAFPTPKTLAAMQEVISSFPQFLLKASGKSLDSIGENNFAKKETPPAAVSTRRMPLQRHIIPQREMTVSTAEEAPSSAAGARAERFPVNAADTTDRTKITQIIFPSIGAPCKKCGFSRKWKKVVDFSGKM